MTPCWREALAQIREEEEEWDFYGRWHALFRETFLERELFDDLYARMVRLLEVCPEDRYLVHTCPGLANVMAHDGAITGVLDWLEARFGDFLFDVATLDFWSPRSRFADRFAEYYRGRGRIVPNYRQRLLCYHLYTGLDGLRFHAKNRDEDGYRWIRDRILDLLKQHHGTLTLDG